MDRDEDVRAISGSNRFRYSTPVMFQKGLVVELRYGSDSGDVICGTLSAATTVTLERRAPIIAPDLIKTKEHCEILQKQGPWGIENLNGRERDGKVISHAAHK